MSGTLPLVSIVCPAFEEEEVLPVFHRNLQAELERLKSQYRFEILLVDDGSSDRTLDVIKEIARNDPAVSYVSLSRNFGHQAALTAGLEHARGDAVISMDADMQHPPHVIPELLAAWREGFDVVITIREVDRELPWFKRVTSTAFYRLMQLVSDTEVRVAAADFRLLSRVALDALLQLREHHRFVRGMVQWLGFRVKECVFHPGERVAGRSKYTFRRMLRLAGDGLFSFSRAPLRAANWVCMGFLGLAMLHAVLMGLDWLQGAGFASWHYLAGIVNLGIGCVLGALGVMGEYIGRVSEQVKQRPLYVIKEVQISPLSASVEPSADAETGDLREAA